MAQDTDVTVAVNVPETLNSNKVEQSVAVAVAQEDVEEEVEEVVLDSSFSLSLFGSGSLTGGFGLNFGLSVWQKKMH